MRKENKTREQLIAELVALRRRIAQLEASGAERRQAEEELGKVREEEAIILSGLSELVAYLNTEMRILWANRAAGDSVGLTPEKLVGRHCYEIWHQRRQPCLNCPVVKTLNTGQPRHGEMTSPDGRMWFVQGHPVKDGEGNIIGAVEITLEVTERRRAEEELWESEQKYRALFENLNDAAFLADVETGRILDTNKQGEILLGYTRGEIIGMQQTELHPPGKAEEYRQRFAAHAKKGHAADYDGEVIRKDGSIVQVDIGATSITIGGKRLMLGLFRDITERKQAEEELKESETKYKGLVDNVKLGIFRSTPGPKGKFLEVNPAMEEITGYSRKELLQMNVADLYIHPEEREPLLDEIASATGKTTRELLLRKKDGSEIVISDTTVAKIKPCGS